MSIVWLASYPKSGNTFARMLLHNYLYGETRDTDVVADRIPGLHYLLAKKIELKVKRDEQKLVKTHFSCSSQHPYFDISSGFIYIIRNPRDVLLSSARYFGATSSPDRLRKFAETFIASLGAPLWRKHYMGTWPEHVDSWLFRMNSMPHVLIKYEELRSDPSCVLERLLRFLGVEPDDSRIQTAVDSCEISKARKHEEEEIKSGRNRVYIQLPNNENFVGEGRTGQSLVGIDEKLELLYRRRFGRFISYFGYE